MTILIGKNIEKKGDFIFLLNSVYPEVVAYTYKLDLDKGLVFTAQHGYYRLHPNFDKIEITKDEIKEVLSRNQYLQDIPF